SHLFLYEETPRKIRDIIEKLTNRQEKILVTNVMIGTIQNMKVQEKNADGSVLKNELGKAFLPNDEADILDETVKVFIYKGQNDQPMATRKLPEVEAGTYGWGVIKEIDPTLGAFVDIGTDF